MQSAEGSSLNRGYGIDLAGYTVGKTRVAEATEVESDHAVVQILSGHVFDEKFGTDEPLAPVVERERSALLGWLKAGRVAVDIPIDLQRLTQFGTNANEIWELTKRPIDRAVGGMSPLADRIGAPTARFQHLLSGPMGGEISGYLGNGLFETYPAASLKMILGGKPAEGYKLGQVRWTGSAWAAGKDGQPSEVLARMCKNLGLYATTDLQKFDDDEFDAALCALAALYQPNPLYSCSGESLVLRVNLGKGPLAAGYVLLHALPSKVHILRGPG